MAPAGVIDPSYFMDPISRKKYLLFKYDGNFVREPSQILIQELNNVGTDFAPNSVARVLLTGGSTMQELVEGQELVKRGEYYYLFYSFGCTYEGCRNEYQMRVARSRSLFGPYEGEKTVLIAKEGGRFFGPGNGSVISYKGQDFFLYSALDLSNPNSKSYARVLLLDKIYWQPDGWPIINDGHPSENPKPLPQRPERYFGKVKLIWQNPGFADPLFSLDVRVNYRNLYTGQRVQKVIGPCLPIRSLTGLTQVEFDGQCLNENQDQVPLDASTEVRICSAERGQWRPGQTICSAYVPINKWNIQVPLSR